MHHATTGLMVVLLAMSATEGSAQLRASERAEVKQTVDGTVITVNYARPRLRGRHDVFGSQVPYGEIWTPGANEATTLAVSRDVTINGQAVPKGKYSVWIPMTRGDWTMVLDRDSTLYHENGPKERAGQIRFAVRKETVPETEVLTWSFPDVRASSTRLVMQWERTAVPLDIAVTPTFTTTVAPSVGKRVEGRYDMQMKPSPASHDTTLSVGVPPASRVTVTVKQDGQQLRANMDPPLWPGYDRFLLIRKSDQLFLLAEADSQGVREVWDCCPLEFSFTQQRATGFAMRAENDEAMATGTRIP